MPAGQVNDAARQLMADVRGFYQAPQWIDLGLAPTQLNSNTFLVAGDRTSFFPAGRRIRADDILTYYGTVSSSIYSAPNTSVELKMDSGDLTSSLERIYVGLVDGQSKPIPASAISGSLVSVGLEAPATFAVSRTPVTSSDTISLTWVAQPSRTVLAGPITGVSATPNFRELTNTDTPYLPFGRMIVFTTSSTDFVPSSSLVYVKLWGGGGGGGGSNATNVQGAGGASGQFSEGFLTVTPNVSLTVVVGNGGAGGSTSAGAGAQGGTSSVVGASMTVSASGGNGGRGAPSGNASWAGGSGTIIVNSGFNDIAGVAGANGLTGPNGAYPGGFGGNAPSGGSGGSNPSLFSGQSAGSNGSEPGGGGGGSFGTSRAGGQGANGRVIIYYP